MKQCMTEFMQQNPQYNDLALMIEADSVATKKRQQEYAIRQAKKAERRRHNGWAPVPFSGFARRKRKNNTYGKFYNFLHTGNWHGVMLFLKSH
jgi:hypothetical protein